MVALECWLCDSVGARVAPLDQALSAQYVRVVNAPGAFTVTLPVKAIDKTALQRDALVEVWRRERRGIAATLEFLGFLRRVQFRGSGGRDTVTVAGPGLLYLLKSRIIAYAAGAAQSAKSGPADNLIKAIVRENLGSSASAARDLTAYGLTVQPDAGVGASVERRFAHREALDTCQRLAEESTQRGTPVFFDFATHWADNALALEFRTYVGQRGADRTHAGGSPVMFGPEYGNVENPALEVDYEDEVTVVYAGGQGTGAYRDIQEVEDTARRGASPWNRRESFANMSSEQTSTGLQSVARAELEAGRPAHKFSCDLVSLPSARYGRDWSWGDKITVSYQGQVFDGWVARVMGQLDGSITGRFQAVPG